MYTLIWREDRGHTLSVASAQTPFGTYFIERGSQDTFDVSFGNRKIAVDIHPFDQAKQVALTDLETRSTALLNFRKVKEQKVLTVEKMKDYLSACEWGDVPDTAHALVAYLVMDGYVLPPTGKMGNRAEQQVAAYAAFYGQASVPTQPGYYWAFWLTATEATVEKEELVPAVKWEIVEVDHNMMGGDPSHPEYWLVAVPGVQAHQYVGNFMWGPRVPDYKAKKTDFALSSGPILDRILEDRDEPGAISAKIRSDDAHARFMERTRRKR